MICCDSSFTDQLELTCFFVMHALVCWCRYNQLEAQGDEDNIDLVDKVTTATFRVCLCMNDNLSLNGRRLIKIVNGLIGKILFRRDLVIRLESVSDVTRLQFTPDKLIVL